MTFGAKITDDDDLIVPVSYREFERLSKDSMCKRIDLELVTYRPLLYDENALLLDFYHTQEDITVKQLRDRHKKAIKRVSFQYKEKESTHEITVNQPTWDIARDSYGQPCIRLNWKDFYSIVNPLL